MLIYDTEWSPDAQDDLDNLWMNICQESCSADVATNFINALIDFTIEECRYPKNGTLIENLSEQYREIYFHKYTIVYEIIELEHKVIVHEIFNQKRVYIRSYRRNQI